MGNQYIKEGILKQEIGTIFQASVFWYHSMAQFLDKKPSKECGMFAYNLELVSDPRQPLNNRVKRLVTKFITTPPIKFSPSNGHPTKELKRKERLKESSIKPQRYQMSPSKFLAMARTAYV